MGWFYRNFARRILFTQDSEVIHDRTLNALGWLSQQRTALRGVQGYFHAPELPSTVFGLRFPNPVGLAAGMEIRLVAFGAADGAFDD